LGEAQDKIFDVEKFNQILRDKHRGFAEETMQLKAERNALQ